MLRGAAMVIGGSLLAAPASGCLPGDTRPTPASVELKVRSADTSSSGFVTDDGWRIDFDALVAGVGTVRIEGDACNPYNQGWYSRVFDFAQPLDEPAKVALLHGIGDCELRFRLRSPQDDSLIADGVAARDLVTMRTEAYDIWARERQGVTLLVRGKATHGERVLTFEWELRVRYDVRYCFGSESGARYPTDLDLASADALERVIDIDASALFRVPAPRPPGWVEGAAVTEDPAAGVPTAFEMFARADDTSELGRQDGVVELMELLRVDADTGEVFDPDPQDSSRRRLADVLYYRMAPAIVRIGDGACIASIDD